VSAHTAETHPGRPASQTLHRGLLVLETLAQRGEPDTVGGLAAALGLHRSIVYRILRTLADHGLVRRHVDGRYGCAVGLVSLARSAFGDLESASSAELTSLADDLGATAFLAVPDGGEIVMLATVEPRRTVAHVRYRAGSRHARGEGALDVALRAAAGPAGQEPRPVAEARARGWVDGPLDVLPGARTVVSGVAVAGDPVAAVGVVLAAGDGESDPSPLGDRVSAAARALADTLA
jgi:DNA-binding IclR family transcriptional regulator